MIVFRCPGCKLLMNAPDEDAGMETYCLKCLIGFSIPRQSQEILANEPRYPWDRGGPTGTEAKLFDPYSEHDGPDDLSCYEYDLLISYANVEPERSMAHELARECILANLRTFYAPESLRAQNLHPDAFGGRWCAELERAVLSSFTLVAVVSPAYLRSAYCDLEIKGFLKITELNPRRGLVVVLDRLSPGQLPSALAPFVCDSNWGSIHARITQLKAASGYRLGSGIRSPGSVFDPLPVDGFSDVWRMHFGPNEPVKRRLFEAYVREYMVLILKGASNPKGSLNWPALLSSSEYKEQVVEAAMELIAGGVNPYPVGMSDWQLPKAEAATLGVVPALPALDSEAGGNPSKNEVPGGDISRNFRGHGGWCDLVDYLGQGYPQNMAFVCRRCGQTEGVLHPDDVPQACRKCGYDGKN